MHARLSLAAALQHTSMVQHRITPPPPPFPPSPARAPPPRTRVLDVEPARQQVGHPDEAHEVVHVALDGARHARVLREVGGRAGGRGAGAGGAAVGARGAGSRQGAPAPRGGSALRSAAVTAPAPPAPARTWIFMTARRPSCSVTPCTWPMLAAAMGVKSKAARRACQSSPSSLTSTCRGGVGRGWGGVRRGTGGSSLRPVAAGSGLAACRCCKQAAARLPPASSFPRAAAPPLQPPRRARLLQLAARHDVGPRPHALQRRLELRRQHVLVLRRVVGGGRTEGGEKVVWGHNKHELLRCQPTTRIASAYPLAELPPTQPGPASHRARSHLDGQHLAQLQRGAAHAAQRVGQPLRVALGHEGGVGAAVVQRRGEERGRRRVRGV